MISFIKIPLLRCFYYYQKKNDHKFETHGSSTDTQWMIMEILYFIGFTALAQHIVLYTSNAKGNCQRVLFEILWIFVVILNDQFPLSNAFSGNIIIRFSWAIIHLLLLLSYTKNDQRAFYFSSHPFHIWLTLKLKELTCVHHRFVYVT